jgi:hypothetical protein
VTTITNSVDGMPVNPLAYTYDVLNRITGRNDDTFDYNTRSEVTSANIATNAFCYLYDGIGNNLWASFNAITNLYTANALNQYTNISSASTPPCEDTLSYDLDGNLIWDGRFTYVWDAENRLAAVYSNSALVVSNAYDHMSRRVLKVTPEATHTYLYDGWNLVAEFTHTQNHSFTNLYIWGKDLSGTYQGYEAVSRLLQDSDAETLMFSHANSTKLVLNYPGSGKESEELSLRSLQRFGPEEILLTKLSAWGCNFAAGSDAGKIRAKLGKSLWAMPALSAATFDVYLADPQGNLVTDASWNAQFRSIFNKHAMTEALYSDALVKTLRQEWKAKLTELRKATGGKICQAYWDVYYQNANLLEEVQPTP